MHVHLSKILQNQVSESIGEVR